MRDNNPTALNALRRRITRRLEHVIDWRIDHRIPPERLAASDRRHDEARELIAAQQRLLDDQRREVDEHRRRVDELVGRVDELSGRLDEVRGRSEWTRNEVERMIPHVASQESQLESLRQKLTTVPVAGGEDADAARALIDEIRREHAQIRARLTGIARYEERLARLEERTTQDDDTHS